MRVNQSYYFTPVTTSQYGNVLAAAGTQLSELLFSNPFSKEFISYQKNPDYKQLTASMLTSKEVYPRLAMQVALAALICFKPRMGIPLAALALVPKLIHRARVDLQKYFPPGTKATLSARQMNTQDNSFDPLRIFNNSLATQSINVCVREDFKFYVSHSYASDLSLCKPLHMFLKGNDGIEYTMVKDGSYIKPLENASYEILLIEFDLEEKQRQAVHEGVTNSDPSAYRKYNHVKLEINFTLPD